MTIENVEEVEADGVLDLGNALLPWSALEEDPDVNSSANEEDGNDDLTADGYERESFIPVFYWCICEECFIL